MVSPENFSSPKRKRYNYVLYIKGKCVFSMCVYVDTMFAKVNLDEYCTLYESVKCQF